MKLTKPLKVEDKIIYTNEGNFKIRKNGRRDICIGKWGKNAEVIKVTPL